MAEFDFSSLDGVRDSDLFKGVLLDFVEIQHEETSPPEVYPIDLTRMAGLTRELAEMDGILTEDNGVAELSERELKGLRRRDERNAALTAINDDLGKEYMLRKGVPPTPDEQEGLSEQAEKKLARRSPTRFLRKVGRREYGI